MEEKKMLQWHNIIKLLPIIAICTVHTTMLHAEVIGHIKIGEKPGKQHNVPLLCSTSKPSGYEVCYMCTGNGTRVNLCFRPQKHTGRFKYLQDIAFPPFNKTCEVKVVGENHCVHWCTENNLSRGRVCSHNWHIHKIDQWKTLYILSINTVEGSKMFEVEYDSLNSTIVYVYGEISVNTPAGKVREILYVNNRENKEQRSVPNQSKLAK